MPPAGDYKDDIAELGADAAGEYACRSNPVTFKYKAGEDERHVGFIAEDVPEPGGHQGPQGHESHGRGGCFDQGGQTAAGSSLKNNRKPSIGQQQVNQRATMKTSWHTSKHSRKPIKS